jgi:hypothetical protein
VPNKASNVSSPAATWQVTELSARIRSVVDPTEVGSRGVVDPNEVGSAALLIQLGVDAMHHCAARFSSSWKWCEQYLAPQESNAYIVVLFSLFYFQLLQIDREAGRVFRLHWVRRWYQHRWMKFWICGVFPSSDVKYID